MKIKELRKERRGLLSIVAVVLIVIVLIAAGVAAYAFMRGGGENPPYNPPGPPGGEDPIIGYILCTVNVVADNRHTWNPVSMSFGTMTCSLASYQTPAASMFDGLDVWNSNTFEGKVRFHITSSGAYGNYDYTGYSNVEIYVGAGGIENGDVTLPNGPAVRYHGTYTVEVTLMELDGDVVASKVGSFTI